MQKNVDSYTCTKQLVDQRVRLGRLRRMEEGAEEEARDKVFGIFGKG